MAAEQPTITADVLTTSFVKAFREMQQPEQTPYELLNKSAFNPSGKPRKENLKYEAVFQNGYKVNPEFMTDEEIALANRIKPGRYNDRKWEVIVREDGEARSLEIRYPSKSQEDRFDLMLKAPSFVQMATQILAELDARKRNKAANNDDE